MVTQEVYYRDAQGTVNKRNIVMSGKVIVAYPDDAFILAGQNLIPNAGYQLLRDAEGAAAYAEQLAKIETDLAKFRADNLAATLQRRSVLQDAVKNGEFGKIKPETFKALFGIDIT